MVKFCVKNASTSLMSHIRFLCYEDIFLKRPAGLLCVSLHPLYTTLCVCVDK